MEEKKIRKPYTLPHITRVVLKREQAILSICSSSAPMVNAPSGTVCTAGCTKTPCPSAPHDDAAQS